MLNCEDPIASLEDAEVVNALPIEVVVKLVLEFRSWRLRAKIDASAYLPFRSHGEQKDLGIGKLESKNKISASQGVLSYTSLL